MTNVQTPATTQSANENPLFPDVGSPRGPARLIRIRFYNFCEDSVDLFWMNEEKKAVKYATLPSRRFIDMSTFEGHPWVSRCAFDGSETLLEGQLIYLPKPIVPAQVIFRGICKITPKDVTLQEKAMRQILKNYIICEPQLQLLPPHLKARLNTIHARLVEYREYVCRWPLASSRTNVAQNRQSQP